MRLGEVGEFNFIDSIARLAGCPAAPVLVGIGDDAAVLDVGSAQKLVVTTDAMVQGVHFRRDWLAPHQIGWRAMAACLSDIAAMGAQPTAVFASVALPADLDSEYALDIVRGLADCARRFDTTLAGGDCTVSPALIFIDTVAIGTTPQPWLRSQARPGDVLMVTGSLGDAAAAVALLSSGRCPDDIPPPLLERFARPLPRLREASILSARGLVNAALDISDGLVQDAGHMATQSGVAIRLESAAVPISDICRAAAAELGHDPLSWALAGGEDFELLLAVPAHRVAEAQQLLSDHCETSLTPVGAVASGCGVTVLDADGQQLALDRSGWDHFSSPNKQ